VRRCSTIEAERGIERPALLLVKLRRRGPPAVCWICCGGIWLFFRGCGARARGILLFLLCFSGVQGVDRIHVLGASNFLGVDCTVVLKCFGNWANYGEFAGVQL
jgi:hypothetical protein